MILPGRVHIGHILQYVGRPLALLFAWDIVVTLGWLFFAKDMFEFPALPLTIFGSAIAIYLSFRNSAAYARWWEGRILWGSAVNYSRTFARQLAMMLPAGREALCEQLTLRHVAFIHALRLHLRRQAPWEELQDRLPAEELQRLRSVANVPNAILQQTGVILANEGGLDSMRLAAVEHTMLELSNAQGGMERIKNTPLPQQYATYPTLLTHLFCILVPLGMVESLGLWTPLGSSLLGFLFLALLQTGDDMQNPFENTENDVPLSTITRGIEIDLRDGLRQSHGLKPRAPEEGTMW